MQVFNYQSKEIRTLVHDSEPWFVGQQGQIKRNESKRRNRECYM